MYLLIKVHFLTLHLENNNALKKLIILYGKLFVKRLYSANNEWSSERLDSQTIENWALIKKNKKKKRFKSNDNKHNELPTFFPAKSFNVGCPSPECGPRRRSKTLPAYTTTSLNIDFTLSTWPRPETAATTANSDNTAENRCELCAD